MKKIKYILLLCTLTFLLTGCVKYNANMDIKKDKSMDFSIIYAFDSSLFEDQKLLEDKDKKELEDRGFTVTDYSQDKMKGFTISKKIKNIDDVSSTYDSEYSISGILDDKSENAYIFKVKKGLIKNTYTAKFKFDASDSDLNNPTDDSSSDLDSDSDFSFDYDSDSSSFDSESDLSDMDFSSMMSNMDLSFNVTLPYSAKSNNASTVNNDGKKLSWNLSSNQVEFIEFEFELYNMTVIYAGVGAIVLILVIIIFIFSNNKNNNSNENGNQSTINTQPIQQSTVDNSQNIIQQTPQFSQTTQSNIGQSESVQQPIMSSNQNMPQINQNTIQQTSQFGQAIQSNFVQPQSVQQSTMSSNQNMPQINQNTIQQTPQFGQVTQPNIGQSQSIQQPIINNQQIQQNDNDI